MTLYAVLARRGFCSPDQLEAFGVNGHIRDICQRMAAEGFVALAPELFHRSAPPGYEGSYDQMEAAIAQVRALTESGLEADIRAAHQALAADSAVDASRIVSIGFCMGGRVSFLADAELPLRASISFYGGGIGSVQPSERTPRAPLDFADGLRCPMLLFFGEDDPFIPVEEVEKIKRRLAELEKNAQTIVYPGAPHGFFCPERDSYRVDAARDAWQRLLRFFEQHLKS